MQGIILFFRLWVWFSLRQLIAHRWRTAAVLTGIALGAAVFTSVRLAINASVDSFSQSVDAITGKADWTVARPGGRIPERLIATLLGSPAVRGASPLLTTHLRPSGANSEPFLLIGLDPVLDRSFRFRSWDSESPTSSRNSSPILDLMAEPRTLLASRKLLDRLHLFPGNKLVLNHLQHNQEFRILDALAPEELAQVEGGLAALTDISSFQELTGLYGVVDRIDLLLKPNATEKDLQAIRDLLPEGVFMEQPGESRESGKLMIRSYQVNLSVLSFVSLFVGMFLVYSLVALHATARRHEISILRSIGASSRQLFLLFIAEGAFFGVIGWLIAVPVSSFLVKLLLGGITETITHLFVRVHVENLTLDPLEICFSFLLTFFIAILAACQPALEAVNVPPREALLMLDNCPKRDDSARRLAALGFTLILLVWPLSRFPAPAGIPVSGYVATFSLFCGFSLLSPWCLRFMGAWLPPILRRLGGMPAYLGGRYARDAGTRVAISVGALITAMALFTALVIMVHSFRNTVELWVNQTISGDLFLRSKMAEINHYRDPVPREIVHYLENTKAPIDILPYRRIFMQYGSTPYQFEPIDFDAFTRHARFLFIEGDSETALPKLARGEGVLASEVFSNKTGLRTGDIFKARVEGIELELPVLGVFRDYRTQGGVVHYSFRRFVEKSGNNAWSGARVHFRSRLQDPEAAAQELRSDILSACIDEQQAIEITIGNDLRREILRIFDETFAITTVLLLIALFVATLGITTTLTVLVLERARQFHTLLAGGASMWQIRSMIFWEAVLMVLTGELIGLACGFILSYLLVFVINQQSFGWTFIYSVSWSALLPSLPLILITALLAALPASRIVFKRSPALILRER